MHVCCTTRHVTDVCTRRVFVVLLMVFQECWCGDSDPLILQTPQAPKPGCTAKCKGDPKETWCVTHSSQTAYDERGAIFVFKYSNRQNSLLSLGCGTSEY